MNEGNNGEYVYKQVIRDKKNSRAWSVASFAVSISGLLFGFLVSWLSIILGVMSIIFAIISRKNIGYFDRFSIAGLIIGIFSVVFGIMGAILMYIFNNLGYFDELYEELDKMSAIILPTKL